MRRLPAAVLLSGIFIVPSKRSTSDHRRTRKSAPLAVVLVAINAAAYAVVQLGLLLATSKSLLFSCNCKTRATGLLSPSGSLVTSSRIRSQTFANRSTRMVAPRDKVVVSVLTPVISHRGL